MPSMKKSSRAAEKRARVLAYIRERGEISRSDLATEFSLDKKTIAGIVDELLEESLVVPSGFRESLAGRRQELLRLYGGHSNFIGIDLGGTHIIGILADLRGAVLDRVFFEIRPGLPVDIILDQMKTICRGLMGSTKATAAVRSIGICAPGFMNPATGTSIVAENIPGWRDVRLREIFEGEFDRPVLVEDSSRAYALAEKWLGEGAGRPDFLLADLGYGIGLAIVVEGELYAGAGNKSGEIGHTIVAPDGPSCACGNRGCLETVASGRAIARDALAGIEAGRSQLLKDLTHGKPESVTAQDVSIAASMGDPFSAELLGSAGSLVGLALANAVNLINPSLLILGGGLIGSNRIVEEAIARALRANCMREIFEDLELRVSKLGIDGSALGCGILAAADVLGRV
jgi:predicted NBD/HSP70 family sugar kinase